MHFTYTTDNTTYVTLFDVAARRVCIHSAIMDLSVKFGVSVRDASGALVMGDLALLVNQCSIAARSYVCPSAATHGSRMRSAVMGHRKCSGRPVSSTSASAPVAAAVDTDALLGDATVVAGNACDGF